MDAMDLSIPLLSMHAPFEVISKVDLFAGMRAYGAFLRS
jgi:aspartyl aminopeptidase